MTQSWQSNSLFIHRLHRPYPAPGPTGQPPCVQLVLAVALETRTSGFLQCCVGVWCNQKHQVWIFSGRQEGQISLLVNYLDIINSQESAG